MVSSSPGAHSLESIRPSIRPDNDRESPPFPTRMDGPATPCIMDGSHDNRQQHPESIPSTPGLFGTNTSTHNENEGDLPRRVRELEPSPLGQKDEVRAKASGSQVLSGVAALSDTTNRAVDWKSPDTALESHKVENNSLSNGPYKRLCQQSSLNGDTKAMQGAFPSDQALGMVFEHSLGNKDAESNGAQRTTLVDVLDGPDVADALNQWSGEMSPTRKQDQDREPVPKLSPAQIQELTSSPQSIPYRAVPSDGEQSRRVVSDNTDGFTSHTGSADESTPLANGIKPPPDQTLKSRISKDFTIDISATRPSTSSARHRPQTSRTVSTPTSSRRQTLPSNERLSQTWASRSRPDRPSIMREIDPKLLNTASQVPETTLPSPMPPSVPLPPLSVPTYLQLELASGRPSPLYIHRSPTSDFPYETSRVKLERLMNFLMLPPVLEQVLWFGILACLDSWLYSFTILPLRFIKALYILLESWVINLAMEGRYISRFVVKGVGRVWRRRNKISQDGASEPHRNSESETRSRQESVVIDRDAKPKGTEVRRRCRSDAHHRSHHRRQKSIPSALLPDDKADILKGLLMISTCAVLMYFDASRMYHWIRGQAAIKLYVIYNVLEVSDRLFAAIGQDVLECLFSREALERRPDGRSKVFRPFGLFLLALAYTVIHATSLFYQVMTLNVAVNSYSNALITLLLSNQFVEIKSTVFKKFEKDNLFQLTCADVVERFQLWLMLTIIASRNIVETGAFNFIGNLGSSFSESTSTNSTPLSTPPRTMSSILPQSFTIVPSSIIASFSNVNSFLPTLAQVLGPFLVVLGSEMLVDWLKHAYIGKFNNTRPAIYNRFLDILAKDYYTNAFGDQNLTRRLGLPVIPLSCLFFRVSVQTYHMFLAALLPQQPSSTAVESTSLSSIYSHYVPAPIPSPPPLTFRTIIPASAAHIDVLFRQLLANAMPSPAQSVYIFTVILILTGYVVLLIVKLLLGMVLLTFARSRYKAMKHREAEQSAHDSAPSRGREYAVEGSRRFGGFGAVEVNDEHRRLIYADDPETLRRLKAREEKAKSSKEELNLDHVRRYDMVAKQIW
ncbi:eukaryotic membrane protein family-domain-containing protein [Aspergillus avenaceus]|uniref:Eukaryotic membrane protein family-domain-containing protein n=1 Tax=Aspergillus avenaceus TaxID=36643 RepID=A0A5N6TXY1_ASPAV|nr:eukaryotic membrane protein family-domain-containing protein [Aspergillus avenaceus]